MSARKRKPGKERDSMSCIVPVWTICPDLEMTAALQCHWRHHKGKWGHKLRLWLGYGNLEGQPILKSHNNKLHFLFFVTFVSSSYWIKKNCHFLFSLLTYLSCLKIIAESDCIHFKESRKWHKGGSGTYSRAIPTVTDEIMLRWYCSKYQFCQVPAKKKPY